MKIIATLAVATLAALLCGCNKPSQPTVQKWEYKVVEKENFEHQMADLAFKEMVTNGAAWQADTASAINNTGTFLLDVDLAEQGKQGWELVSAIPLTETTHPVAHDEIIAAVRTGEVILIFKRPAQ